VDLPAFGFPATVTIPALGIFQFTLPRRPTKNRRATC
jgi:hypothetical protein